MEPVRLFFQNLPRDVNLIILGRLGLREVVRLSGCSKFLLNLINKHNATWQRLAAQNFHYAQHTDCRETLKNCYLAKKNVVLLQMAKSGMIPVNPLAYTPQNFDNYHFHNGGHYELNNAAIVRTLNKEKKCVPTSHYKLHTFSDCYYATSHTGQTDLQNKAVKIDGGTLTLWKDLTPIVGPLNYSGYFKVYNNFLVCLNFSEKQLVLWNLETQEQITINDIPRLQVIGIANGQLFAYEPRIGFHLFLLKDKTRKCIPFPKGLDMNNYSPRACQMNDRFLMVDNWAFPLEHLDQPTLIEHQGFSNTTQPTLDGDYVYYIQKGNNSNLDRINLTTKQTEKVHYVQQNFPEFLSINQYIIYSSRLIITTAKDVRILDLTPSMFSSKINSWNRNYKTFLQVSNGLLLEPLNKEINVYSLAGVKIANIPMQNSFGIKEGYIGDYGAQAVIHNLLEVPPPPPPPPPHREEGCVVC